MCIYADKYIYIYIDRHRQSRLKQHKKHQNKHIYVQQMLNTLNIFKGYTGVRFNNVNKLQDCKQTLY